MNRPPIKVQYPRSETPVSGRKCVPKLQLGNEYYSSFRLRPIVYSLRTVLRRHKTGESPALSITQKAGLETVANAAWVITPTFINLPLLNVRSRQGVYLESSWIKDYTNLKAPKNPFLTAVKYQ
jgi:hypothetical protein